MFADPGWRLVGTRWKGTYQRGNAYGLGAHLLGTFRDGASGLPAARFEGTVTYGIAALRKRGQLAVLDAADAIVGLAEFSSIGPDAHSLRIDVPRKRGFDGYIRAYDARKAYRLVVLDAANGSATVLATLGTMP
jgi:hypothetical protein